LASGFEVSGEVSEVAWNAENVGFADQFYLDSIVVACYVAFHAFGAVVKGTVAKEVYLCWADFHAFAVVFFAAGCAVSYFVVFAFFWAPVHYAFLLIHFWFYEWVKGGSEVDYGADWAEFVAPETSFFETHQNGYYRKNQ